MRRVLSCGNFKSMWASSGISSPKVLGGSLGHLPPGEGDRRARALLPNLKVLKKTRSERTDQTREPKGTRTLDSEGSGWASGGRRRPVLVKNVIVVDFLRPVSGPVSGRSPVPPAPDRSPVLRSRARVGPETRFLRSRARVGPETWQGRGLDSPTFGQGARAFKGNSVLREGC